MPFAFSDGDCAFCHEGLKHVGASTADSSATRRSPGRRPKRCASPLQTGRLYALTAGRDDALLPSLLTLSDVMGTGHHAAVTARVGPGKTVAVCRGRGRRPVRASLAARRLGAEQSYTYGHVTHLHPESAL